MVTNSRMVLILVSLVGLYALTAEAAPGGPIGRYLSDTAFKSGFRTEEICERKLTSSAPAFRKRDLKEQVLELHFRTHDFMVAAFEGADLASTKGEALQDLAVRLRILGEVSPKKLAPYSGELLAMAFEAGTVSAMADRLESLTLQNLGGFFEKVLEVSQPANSIERTLAIHAAASLAEIRSAMIERSKDPLFWLQRTLDVLAKASSWQEHNFSTVLPLLNASLLATAKAVRAYPKVPKEQKIVFVGMTEAMFSGAEVMLKNLSLQSDLGLDSEIKIIMDLYSITDSVAFPEIAKALNEWAHLLGVTKGDEPTGSNRIN